MFDSSRQTLRNYASDALLHQADTRQTLRRFVAVLPRWLLPSHNRALTTLLLDILDRSASAPDKPGLLKSLEPAKEFGRPIAYKQLLYKLIILVGSIALSIGSLFYLMGASDFPRTDVTTFAYYVALPFIAVFMLVVPLALVLAEDGLTGAVTVAVYERAVEIDNSLVPQSIGGLLKADEYGGEFREFRRGTVSHTIKLLETLPLPLPSGAVQCEYYHQYYVDSHTDSKGNKISDPHHRYGLIMPYPGHGEVVVGNGDGLIIGVEWKTESADFNGRFKVIAADQQQAARFLQPTVILAFLEIQPMLSDICVEIGTNNRLCMSFTDADLLDVPRRADIADPKHLSLELNNKLVPEKLSRALGFLAKLSAHAVNPQ